MANKAHYGLAAYMRWADLDEATGTANRTHSGWVQVNRAAARCLDEH